MNKLKEEETTSSDLFSHVGENTFYTISAYYVDLA